MKVQCISILLIITGLMLTIGCSSDEGLSEFAMKMKNALDKFPAVTGAKGDVMTNEEINAFLVELNKAEPGTDIIAATRMPGARKTLDTSELDQVEPGEYAILETSMGIIIFEFYPDLAPNHCKNFKWLANSGFYDGTTFHRIIPDFMIQGGDILTRNNNPADDGTGNPGYSINAEFNDTPHTPGVVSTARSRDPNSAGSQFFIMHGTASHLDGQYTAFGKVVEGMDVVNAIAAVERDQRDRPLENVTIKRARVLNPDK